MSSKFLIIIWHSLGGVYCKLKFYTVIYLGTVRQQYHKGQKVESNGREQKPNKLNEIKKNWTWPWMTFCDLRIISDFSKTHINSNSFRLDSNARDDVFYWKEFRK